MGEGERLPVSVPTLSVPGTWEWSTPGSLLSTSTSGRKIVASRTLDEGPDELIVDGPGRFDVTADLDEPTGAIAEGDVMVNLVLRPALSESAMELGARLERIRGGDPTNPNLLAMIDHVSRGVPDKVQMASGAGSPASPRTRTRRSSSAPCSRPPTGPCPDGGVEGASPAAAAPSPGAGAPGARCPSHLSDFLLRGDGGRGSRGARTAWSSFRWRRADATGAVDPGSGKLNPSGSISMAMAGHRCELVHKVEGLRQRRRSPPIQLVLPNLGSP